jgi:prephenate dehydrogenase
VKKIIGVDTNEEHIKLAKKLGLIHQSMALRDAVEFCQIIILATPVDVSLQLLPEILAIVDKQVVFDVGSTKGDIVHIAGKSLKRGRYVATHPMAGTEYSGPEAAISNLFKSKSVILCDTDKSDNDAFQLVSEIYTFLGMNIIQMNTKSHDLHAAYVSHISHISSFTLALTVLEKEKQEKNILAMAGGGFDSTVRLAKSSPAMWTPILLQNSDNIITVIESYIEILNAFKDSISRKDADELNKLIFQSNKITKIVDKFKNKLELANLL